MNCARTHLVAMMFVLAGLTWPANGQTSATRWKGFNSEAALDRTARQTAPDIRTILEDDLPRVLTSEERAKLSDVRIEFPREDSSHPMNFSSNWRDKRITAPVSSLRFLRDMVVAYAWLSAKGYDLQSVTDYLCMIKYQWPDRLRGVAHSPIEALGVPENALDDATVAARFQQLYGTMVVFTLGHELGHIYHRHPGYNQVSPETARKQEEEADTFALTLLARLGEAPVGASLYFHILTHLESFAGDPDFRADRANRAHPLSPQRIEAIAAAINSDADRFAGAKAARAIATAGELRVVAKTLSDESVQESLRRIGLSTTVETLRPRKPGELPKLAGEGVAEAGVFSGTFVGKWLDAKGTDLDVKMVLNRKGDSVEGTYTLFTVVDGKQYNHGSGAVTLSGTVRDDTLEYEWHWGTDYFGRGRLRAAADAKTLSGTWGYTKAVEGGGTWKLSRPQK
jgi:hypothetical protein